jgi:hypothetical protein
MYRWINQDRLPAALNAQLPVWPWYDAAQINDIPTSIPRIQPGSAWWDVDNGNAFAYVQAKVALTLGQLVYKDLPTIDTIAAPVVGTNDNISTLGLVSGGLTPHAEIGNWVNIENAYATPATSIRKIKDNAAAVLTISMRDQNSAVNQQDIDVLPAALTTGTNIQIIRPWLVNLCTASKVPCGVALGAVTAGYYTIIQIAGLAMVKALGSTAIVAGVPVINTAGGVVIGIVSSYDSNTTVIDSDLYTQGVQIVPLVACTETATSGTPIPCNVNFIAGM